GRPNRATIRGGYGRTLRSLGIDRRWRALSGAAGRADVQAPRAPARPAAPGVDRGDRASYHVYRARPPYTRDTGMRTNIAREHALMAEALKATGLKTKREVVELGLRTLVRLRQQARIRAYRGKLPWDGEPGAGITSRKDDA